MWSFVFWVAMPCGLTGTYQRFEEMRIQSRCRQCVPPKLCYLPTSPHGITTHNTNIDVFLLVNLLWKHTKKILNDPIIAINSDCLFYSSFVLGYKVLGFLLAN
jgi:hypothetical protein